MTLGQQGRLLLDDLWRRSAGLPELEPHNFIWEEWAKEEWSREFERLMRHRLVMGALRYGRNGIPGKGGWNRTFSIKKRIDIYEKTGNLEMLVDCANLCMLEYLEGEHPKAHLSGYDCGFHTSYSKN